VQLPCSKYLYDLTCFTLLNTVHQHICEPSEHHDISILMYLYTKICTKLDFFVIKLCCEPFSTYMYNTAKSNIYIFFLSLWTSKWYLLIFQYLLFQILYILLLCKFFIFTIIIYVCPLAMCRLVSFSIVITLPVHIL
jgi:hypothetical protein